MASAVQYGLLEKTVGEGYKLTQMAQHLISPYSDEEKADNIIECFKKPKLYSDIIERYKGQALPTDSQFYVVLNRFHNITESAVAQAAKVFIQNATFAGLLNKHRILSDSVTTNTLVKIDLAEEEKQNEPAADDFHTNTNNGGVTPSPVSMDTNRQPLLLRGDEWES